MLELPSTQLTTSYMFYDLVWRPCIGCCLALLDPGESVEDWEEVQHHL